MSDRSPLPTADAASALRRDSVKALYACLPSNDFIFREEPGDDYGVDGTLEVLAEGAATNMRAHVQLKARSGTVENADGSVSVSIETANLNYLLNGGCPMYILYRPEAKELRFVFAQPERRRIAKANPSWRTAETVTLRFSDADGSHRHRGDRGSPVA